MESSFERPNLQPWSVHSFLLKDSTEESGGGLKLGLISHIRNQHYHYKQKNHTKSVTSV